MTAQKINRGAINILLVILLIFGCSENPITGPQNSEGNGIPTEELSIIPWNAQMKQMIRSLSRDGFDDQIIGPEGGLLGVDNTYGNSVYFPPGALSEDVEFSLEVICIENNQQCGAGVELLPSMNFNEPVLITLSWAYLDFDGELDAADIYFSQLGDYWFFVDGFELNNENETISFWIDHFTTYAWEFDGE